MSRAATGRPELGPLRQQHTSILGSLLASERTGFLLEAVSSLSALAADSLLEYVTKTIEALSNAGKDIYEGKPAGSQPGKVNKRACGLPRPRLLET